MTASSGQGGDGVSGEGRRHRFISEDSHSPKSANGSAITPAPTSRPSCKSCSALPKLVSEVNQELFTSGAVILPGRGRVTAL